MNKFSDIIDYTLKEDSMLNTIKHQHMAEKIMKKRKTILSNIMSLSNRWLDGNKINSVWNQFIEESKIKTFGIINPTTTDRNIIWNLFYDKMINAIEPLVEPQNIEENKNLRPAGDRLSSLVESRSALIDKIKISLREMKEDIINYIFMEDIEESKLNAYSQELAEKYAEANAEFGGKTINLIDHYIGLNMLVPGYMINQAADISTSIVKRMELADKEIMDNTNKAIDDLENIDVVINTNWKFDRDRLDESTTKIDGSAPAVFRDQFIKLLKELPYFGSSIDQAKYIYNQIIDTPQSAKDVGTQKFDDSRKAMRQRVENPKEIKPEESSVLYPSSKRKFSSKSVKQLLSNTRPEEKINATYILENIRNIINTYKREIRDHYEGTNKLAAVEKLTKDPSRDRPGLGAMSGINDSLKTIASNLGMPDMQPWELKNILINNNTKYIPNILIFFAKKIQEIKNFVEKEVPNLGYTDSDDINTMIRKSMPESYSRILRASEKIGKNVDPIELAHNNIINNTGEDKLEPGEYKSEEEIRNSISEPSKMEKELKKFRAKQNQKEIESKIDEKAEKLLSQFLSSSEIDGDLKSMTTGKFAQELRPVFEYRKSLLSSMVLKLTTVKSNSVSKFNNINKIIDLVTSINGTINTNMCGKIVKSAISNNDFDVLDVLVRSSENPKSVSNLMKAAISVGVDATKWAIDFIKQMSNPPFIQLNSIPFNHKSQYENSYVSLKKFGVPDKKAIYYSLPIPRDESGTIKGNKLIKIYAENLDDIIEIYGKDRYKNLKIKNPDMSPEEIAEMTINDSYVVGKINILNPMNYEKGSEKYRRIIDALITETRLEPQPINALDYLIKHNEEFETDFNQLIDGRWKANSDVGPSVAINNLQQKLSKLIKELTTLVYRTLNKNKGNNTSSEDIMLRLPKHIKDKIRTHRNSHYISKDALDNLISDNISPGDHNMRIRKDEDIIINDLIFTYKALSERISEYQEELKNKPEDRMDDQEINVDPYIFGIINGKIALKDRTKLRDEDAIVINTSGLDGDKLSQSFIEHMNNMPSNKEAAQNDGGNIVYYLNDDEVKYAIGGLTSNPNSESNMAKYGIIIGHAIDLMEEAGYDEKALEKAKRLIIIPEEGLKNIKLQLASKNIQDTNFSSEEPTQDIETEKTKQLEKNISADEEKIDKPDMGMRQKNKLRKNLKDKKSELQATKAAEQEKLEQEKINKQKLSTEIERMIEVMPEKEKQIRQLAMAGHSPYHIMMLIGD